jgi:hypothetical protein
LKRDLISNKKNWVRVAEVEVPDDPFPDIIIWNGRSFYYDYPAGEFIEAEVLEIKE